MKSVRTEAVSAVEAPSVEETVHVVGEPIVVSQQPRLSAKNKIEKEGTRLNCKYLGKLENMVLQTGNFLPA